MSLSDGMGVRKGEETRGLKTKDKEKLQVEDVMNRTEVKAES